MSERMKSKTPSLKLPGIVWLFLLLIVFYYAARHFGLVPEVDTIPEHGELESDSTAIVVDDHFETIDYTVARGQTLSQILHASVAEPAEVAQVIEAVKNLFDPRRLKPGQPLQLKVDSTGALQELRLQPTPEVVIKVQRDQDNQFVSLADSLSLVTEAHFITGEIQNTLYDAVMTTGETPELLSAYADIFQWDVDFFIDTRRGDKFRILFEKRFIEPEAGERQFVRYGRILAASYEQANDSYAAVLYQKPDGKEGYYDLEGRAFQKVFLKSPLNYTRISSYFSYGRKHPVLRKVRAHTGVDFAAPTGTPVVATADGVIEKLEWYGGYGRAIVIRHGGHFSTLYGHLTKYASGLAVGKRVTQRQVIGFVGATGLATGPHLHYTMFLNGRPINPLRIRPTSAQPLVQEQLPAFLAHRDTLLAQLGYAIPPPALAQRKDGGEQN